MKRCCPVNKLFDGLAGHSLERSAVHISKLIVGERRVAKIFLPRGSIKPEQTSAHRKVARRAPKCYGGVTQRESPTFSCGKRPLLALGRVAYTRLQRDFLRRRKRKSTNVSHYSYS